MPHHQLNRTMSEPHHSQSEARIVSLTTEELRLLTSVADGSVPKAGAFAISITRDRKYVVQRQPNGSNHSLGRVEEALASAQRELRRRQPVLRVVAVAVCAAAVALTVALQVYTQPAVATSVASSHKVEQRSLKEEVSATAVAGGDAVAIRQGTSSATETFHPQTIAKRIIGEDWSKGGTSRQRLFARSAVLRVVQEPELARALIAVIDSSVEIEQFGDSEVWAICVSDRQVLDRAFQGPAGPMSRYGDGKVEWVRGPDYVVWRGR